MQSDRFAGGCRFVHQIVNQTTPDTGVSILRQKRNVSQQYLCIIPVNQHSPNRAPVQKNDSIIYSRISSFTCNKLHPNKGSLLIVIPTDSCQFIDTRADVNLQQKGLVVGRRRAQIEFHLYFFN